MWGTVSYGFALRVDLLIYNLVEISKYKTQRMDDLGKTFSLCRDLPVPDNYFKHENISTKTGKRKPNELTVNYEPAANIRDLLLKIKMLLFIICPEKK